MTAPDNDDLKRAEEIAVEFTIRDLRSEMAKVIAQALSEVREEQRAQTLNSEAVQGLLNHCRHDDECSDMGVNEIDCECGWTQAYKQFQQFKDGK